MKNLLFLFINILLFKSRNYLILLLVIAGIHIAPKIIHAIGGFLHSLALTLPLSSCCCSPGTLRTALVASLIAEVALQIFLDGPVTHVTLEEDVVFPSL
jgi:hypothetical protein